MKEIQPVLLIIDPLQAYLGAKVDMHMVNYVDLCNQVRPVLTHLGNLAQKHSCTIVLVMHMNKGEGGKALYRGLGSIDFNAAARSVLVMGRNPKDPEQKIIAHVKSNLAASGRSIAFHIDDEAGIVFDGFSDLSADQILGPARKREKSEDKATAFLKAFLKEEGYAELSDIRTAAESAGIAGRTLYRAKQHLGLKDLTVGFHPKTTWWMLPDVEESELRQQKEGVV